MARAANSSTWSLSGPKVKKPQAIWKKCMSLRDQDVCVREKKEEQRDVWWPKNLHLISNVHQKRQALEIDTLMDRKSVERERIPLDCCNFLSPTLWYVLFCAILSWDTPVPKPKLDYIYQVSLLIHHGWERIYYRVHQPNFLIKALAVCLEDRSI